MTQTTDQNRAEFEDGAWYWVEKEGWHDEPPEIAPAMYRANSKAWYSYRFGGIPTRELKILEPCLMQASRRAQVVPHDVIEAARQLHRSVRAKAFDMQHDDAYKPMWEQNTKDAVKVLQYLVDAAAPQPPEGLKRENPATKPEAAAEHEALRSVYEAARGLLRYEGVDDGRAITYRAKLESAIEGVKHIDSGLWEPPEAACNPSMQPLPELATFAAPVQMPEPYDYVSWYQKGYDEQKRTALYTEHQVRQLLAQHGIE